MVEIVLGNKMKKNIAQVPLSNTTVTRRISDMATDIKDQVVQEIKSSAFGLFSIQLDESTDVASCSQLMMFARYVHSDSFKEEFLFCSPLDLTTKASDILEKVSSFFESENLSWDDISGCCIDEAPAMLGTKSGFQVCVKKRASSKSERHLLYDPSSGTSLKSTSCSAREGFGSNNYNCKFCQRRGTELMTFQAVMY
ncbi:protein FAM200C-like [Palaemon carinicauda]|uniref:protein FAM200C-like n=1 Tax=Palaemon carinicauda TaxID=392227 RepID=UPI0035B6827D